MFFYEAAKIEIIFYTAMIFNEIFLLLQLYLMQNSYLCTQKLRKECNLLEMSVG